MKLLLLAGTAFLGIAAAGSTARAVPFDFTYTGSLVTFTVPTTDSYQILAFGAQGGSGTNVFGVTGPGGLGAEIGGDFALAGGEIIQIAVGGAGRDNVGGGGGGSFVVGPGNAPLIIAGGGGGGGAALMTALSGQGGLTGPNGGGLNGGTGGNGGGGGAGVGGSGGGGFFSGGGNGFNSTGGGAFPDLAGGLIGGGFGGGGGAAGGSGGGGGYSGGGGGNELVGTHSPGGGGGSFDAGIDQILVADIRTGDGEVIITELVPEPGSVALLGAGLLSLFVAWRRPRPRPER